MKISTLALTLVSLASARAFATPSFTPVASGAAHVSVFSAYDGSPAAIVENRDGSFEQYALEGTFIPIRAIPGSNAVNGKGLAAVRDLRATFVFEVEKTGLWYNKLRDGLGVWDGWCFVSNRTDLLSAPAAVFLGDGNGFEVFVQTTANALAIWHIATTDLSPSCGTESQIASNTTIIEPPVAVSGGGNRYDVFGMNASGRLRHWWANDGISPPQLEDTFTINGASRPFSLAAAAHNLAAMASGTHMDIVFRDGNDAIQHLVYGSGWSIYTASPSAPNTIVDVSWRFDTGAPGFLSTAAFCSSSTLVCEDTDGYRPFTYPAPSGLLELRGIPDGRDTLHYELAIETNGELIEAQD
jgi:hypothetical protein